jgi:hypothetical protein
MTTQTEAKEKITAAELASDCAVGSWRAATASLDGNVGMNGYGILRDPSELRAKLLDARKHIDQGLLYLADVKWPTNADYDRAEGGA